MPAAQDTWRDAGVGAASAEAAAGAGDKGGGGTVGAGAGTGARVGCCGESRAVYASFVLFGIGFLVPFNTFVNAVDYFAAVYRGGHIEFYIALVYLWCTLTAMSVNQALVVRIAVHWRILFGYTMFLAGLLVVPALDPGVSDGDVSTDAAYGLTLAAIGLVGIGSGVQQSSYYGFAAMLPSRYTQGLMVGEGVAGLLVSLNRIVTRAAFGANAARGSIYAYFTVAMAIMLLCAVVFQRIRRAPMVQYYVQSAAAETAAAATVAVENSSAAADGIDGAEDEANVTSGHDIALLVRSAMADGASQPAPRRSATRCVGRCGPWMRARAGLLRIIRLPALSVATVFFATLAVFPGVLSEAQSSSLGDWFPVLLFALFNGADTIGKALAAFRPALTPRQLLLACVVRGLVTAPLVVLCVVPTGAPLLPTEAPAIIASLLLGGSGGYLGSYAMIQGAKLAPPMHRELAGNMMTLALMLGLTLGSTFAILLSHLIGAA